MNTRFRTLLKAALLVAIAAAAACGTGTPHGDTVTVHATATGGGTISDKAGKANLAIPGGALDKDTDITLAVSAATGEAVGDILDFGPSGLRFAKPATLSVKADPSLAPADKTLSIALEDNGTFKAVEGSTFANGVVSAPITHFSKYTIIVVNGQGVLQPPASCADAFAKFKACGGDVKGTWTFTDYCLDPKQYGGQDPFNGKCPQGVVSVDFKNDGTVTFDGTKVTTSASTSTMTYALDFPISCIPATDAGTPSCASIAQQAKFDSCTQTAAAHCVCTRTQTSQGQPTTNPYTVSGSTLVVNDPASSSGPPTFEFCQQGNLATLRDFHADGGAPSIVWVVTRK